MNFSLSTVELKAVAFFLLLITAPPCGVCKSDDVQKTQKHIFLDRVKITKLFRQLPLHFFQNIRHHSINKKHHLDLHLSRFFRYQFPILQTGLFQIDPVNFA